MKKLMIGAFAAIAVAMTAQAKATYESVRDGYQPSGPEDDILDTVSAKLSRLEKLTKSSVANRINKNGWIRGIIEKGNHTYIIERGFSPNTLVVFKDDANIDSYGVSSAQDYIDNEIVDIPIQTFSNMISISMKKFKSFLNPLESNVSKLYSFND